MALYGYTRVSTDEQKEGSSLDTQHQALVSYGVPPENIFSDDGVSGAKPLDTRKAGEVLLSVLRHGDTIVATKVDRLFRDARDALNRVQKLKDDGVAVVLLDIGTGPVTENGPAKMFFTMMSAIAEFERTRIAERISEGKAAKAATGGFAGGGTPFGYRKVGERRCARLEPIKRELEAIETIKRLRTGTKPANFSTITTVLQSEGLKISRETVRRICNRTEGRQPPKRRKKGSLK